MCRRFIKHIDRNIKTNLKFGLKACYLREASLVDDFYREEMVVEDRTVVFHRDPLHVLFNQKRLNKLSTEQVKEWLMSMQSHDSNLQELKTKCSDEQLIQMIRSRSLQTPSEILLYCREMKQNQDQFNADLKAAMEAIEASKKQEPNVESKLE